MFETVNETQDSLIRAAEEAIRRVGLDELSLRDVTSSAGANLAAVNYHFGGKTGLLYALLERRLAPVHRERLRRLAELLERTNRQPTLEPIVAALVDPLFDVLAELGDLAPTLMELALRLMTQRERPPRVDSSTSLVGMLRRFDEAIGLALPELPADERWRRVVYVTSLLFHVVMLEPFMRELDGNFALGSDLERVRASLRQFAVAGLSAPPPPAPKRKAAARKTSQRRKS
jgi:AcrR family transcriptional regulator